MKNTLLLIVLLCVLSCTPSTNEEAGIIGPVDWNKRKVQLTASDSLVRGSSYLSVYSEIYQRSDQLTYQLTTTVSIRNISTTDSVFVLHADYYNTQGERIRTYVDDPVYLRPLETIEIVIDESDQSGGTGANFIFDWATRPRVHEPLFEAVMISTNGQQGLSFTTQGVRR
jgi:hypothetical protein